MPHPDNISKYEPLSEGDKAYYRQRQRNRAYEQIITLFVKRVEETGLTKKDLAFITGKDKASITRCLSAPSNLTLDTISDLLLAMKAEMELRAVEFSDRTDLKRNYEHPLLIHCEQFATADVQVHWAEQETTFHWPELIIRSVSEKEVTSAKTAFELL